LEGGPPSFSQDNTCPDLLWILLDHQQFRLRGYHPLWPSFPTCSSIVFEFRMQSTTPSASTWFALIPFRSPLLWESRLISLPSGTEMFHFPEFASYKYDNMNRSMLGRPIQKSPDQSFLAAPRGLSQPSTSFIASTSQGIHLWPLISFF
jgi:hypothetical protein